MALTLTIDEHSFWKNDHEEPKDFQDMLKVLAKEWKNILKEDNATLDIEDFTRAGMTYVLNGFATSLHDVWPDWRFKWQ